MPVRVCNPRCLCVQTKKTYKQASRSTGWEDFSSTKIVKTFFFEDQYFQSVFYVEISKFNPWKTFFLLEFDISKIKFTDLASILCHRILRVPQNFTSRAAGCSHNESHRTVQAICSQMLLRNRQLFSGTS